MNKIRQAFADTMLEVGQKDPRLVVLIGDISHFLLQPFAKACPHRFYNIGICEPTIMNMAAGLSKVGFYPVVHTFASFIVERSFEQIKVDFGYQKLGVNILSVGSGFDAGRLGCTHHCYGDFALLKTIPRTQLIYPASPMELNLLFKETYNNGFPTYIRLPEGLHGVEFKPSQIKFGKGLKVHEGNDLTIVALGPQLKTAIEALPHLYTMRITADVLYFSTVKPLDEELLLKSIRKTRRLLILEEHSKFGGITDDVLRLTYNLRACQFASINLEDSFIHQYGSYEELAQAQGFTVPNIIRTVRDLTHEIL